MGTAKIVKIKYILNALMIGSVFLIWHFYPIQFETNDDYAMMGLLAGFSTGMPQPTAIFLGYPYSFIVYFLYKINQNIPWYTVVFMFLILASLIVFFNNILCFAKNYHELLIVSLFYICIFTYVFLYSTFNVQFTTVSAFCGVAAISIVIKRIIKNENSKTDIIVFFLMCFFGYNIRLETGLTILFCIFLIGGLSLLFKRMSLTLIHYLLIGFFLFLFSYCTNTFFEYKYNVHDFKNFYSYERSQFKDYPKLDYDEYTDIYKAVGWDETLYDAACTWFFMDENINYQTFKEINDAKESVEKNEFGYSIKNTLKNLSNNADFSEYIKVCIFLGIFLGVSCYSIFLKNKNRDILFELLLAVILMGTASLCMVYFEYIGRFPRRVYNMLLALFFCPVGMVSLHIILNLRRMGGYVGLSIPVMCCYIYSASFGAQMVRESPDYREDIKICQNLEKYAIDNRDNLYIYDYSMTMSGYAFQTYPDDKPINLMFYGGWTIYSPLYYEQLNKNGFDSMYSKDFFKDNIFFVGKTEPDEKLVRYMKKRYPECKCVITDRKPDFVVYKFIFR